MNMSRDFADFQAVGDDPHKKLVCTIAYNLLCENLFISIIIKQIICLKQSKSYSG